jgi:hypothetical protein
VHYEHAAEDFLAAFLTDGPLRTSVLSSRGLVVVIHYDPFLGKICIVLTSLHPEIDDFWMEHSAFSGQRSAKNAVIMRFFLKAESEMLIALIRK